MLRAVIGDSEDDHQEFTDQRLLELIVVAAKLVRSGTCFLDEFEVSVDCPDGELQLSIMPEPSDLFCSLIVMKAACMLYNAELRGCAGIEGITAICGRARISNSTGSGCWQLLIENGPCAAFDELKKQLEFVGPLSKGTYFRAIISPYIKEKYCCGTELYDHYDLCC